MYFKYEKCIENMKNVYKKTKNVIKICKMYIYKKTKNTLEIRKMYQKYVHNVF
jgi:hypothetical protein